MARVDVRRLDHVTGRSPASSDEILVDRFLAGEEAAFTQLVDRHSDRLYGFLRFVLRIDRAEADDLAQDTFIEAYRALSSFAKRSTFRTWLYGVARNVWRHHRRGSRCFPRHDVDETVLLDIPDGRLDPFEALEQTRRQECVQRAIERLAPDHRAVIFLRDIETLSYEEIAHLLDVPVGTVRSRLHNARVKLARDLERSAARNP